MIRFSDVRLIETNNDPSLVCLELTDKAYCPPDPDGKVKTMAYRQGNTSQDMLGTRPATVITPATTPFRPEHIITKLLLSGRNKHGRSTSPVPVITPATTPCRPEHINTKFLLSGRNKHGRSNSPDELCHSDSSTTTKMSTVE
ncbi:jg4819 [Pararge aegeria aegeria]|uniref:Jg4819 protein n=1 Tax=Pararge aegeria aegeria TaxID=348720 RepID=A0A8S4SJ24_9NEOP|nr:jg4819 [Pararge aegeria aegeria]